MNRILLALIGTVIISTTSSGLEFKSHTGYECGLSGYQQKQGPSCVTASNPASVERYLTHREPINHTSMSCPGSVEAELKRIMTLYHQNFPKSCPSTHPVEILRYFTEIGMFRNRKKMVNLTCKRNEKPATCHSGEYREYYGERTIYPTCDDTNLPIYNTCDLLLKDSEVGKWIAEVETSYLDKSDLLINFQNAYAKGLRDEHTLACTIKSYEGSRRSLDGIISDLKDDFFDLFFIEYDGDLYDCQSLPVLTPSYNGKTCNAPDLIGQDFRQLMRDTDDRAEKRFLSLCYADSRKNEIVDWFSQKIFESGQLASDLSSRSGNYSNAGTQWDSIIELRIQLEDESTNFIAN